MCSTIIPNALVPSSSFMTYCRFGKVIKNELCSYLNNGFSLQPLVDAR